MRHRLKHTVVLPILALFLCVSAGIALIAYRVNVTSLERIQADREREKSDNIRFTIKAIVDNHVKSLEALARILQENKELSESLAYASLSGSLDPVNDVVARLFPTLNVDILLVTDRRGEVVKTRPMDLSGPYPVPAVAAALDGRLTVDAEEGPEGWAVRAIAPVYWPLAHDLYGTVVVGVRIGDKFAGQIAQAVGAQISFAHPGGELLASSASEEHRRLIQSARAAASVAENRFSLDHDPVHALSIIYAPIRIAGEAFCLIVQQDISQSLALLQRERRNLWWMLAGIVGLVFLAALWLIFFVVRPLRSLETKTQAMINDFSGSFAYAGRGSEIGRLTKSFDFMTDTLHSYVADRKKAEEELEDSRRRLEEIIDFLPDPTWVVDNQGRVVAWNRAIEKLTGVKAADMLGKGDFEHAIPFYGQPRPVLIDLVRDWDERYTETYVSLRRSGEDLVSEEVFIPSLGEGGLYLAATARALWDSDGRPAGAIESVRDITERKRAEKELMVQKTYLEQLFEASTEAIAFIDAQDRVQRVNSQFTSIFGYAPEEVIGRSMDDTVIPESRRAEAKSVKSDIRQGLHLFHETVRRRKDGTLVEVSITGMPVRVEGQDVGIYAIYRDISARKQAERELKKARQAAEAANRAKSDFLANMSHEIRTPMNSVLGFLALALEDPALPTQHRRNLTIANNSARSLLGLINDILDLSKLESGNLEFEEKPFHLERMLRDTMEVLDIKAREKGLTLTLDLHPDLSGNFLGDSLRLAQVIINLAGNAIKFTETGGVSLGVYPAPGQGGLHFAVADTGIGIPPERIDKIFESFTQAESSTSRRYGGTGLGTTISKQLVELMGGRIWAESTPGKGSTFHFTLPLKRTDLPAEDAPLSDVPSLPTGTGRRLRILLAEDVEENITLARIRLDQQGHEVIVARTGREAVDAYQRGGIDLILMDVHMPEMDGIEATRRIRELETASGRHTPVIATTASVMSVDREACLKEGMDAVVGKPIDFRELFDVIARLMPLREEAPEVMPEDIGMAAGQRSLPPLDGVDAVRGLETWRDRAAYVGALMSFCATYRDAAGDLSQLLDQGDMEGAHRLAHTLKGVAGNLSAVEVYRNATRISAVLKEGRAQAARPLIDELDAALQRVVASIRQLEVPAEGEEEPRQDVDLDRVSELLANMLSGFEQFNPDAVEPYLRQIEALLPARQTAPIAKRVDAFDFIGAKAETLKLAAALGIDLEG